MPKVICSCLQHVMEHLVVPVAAGSSRVKDAEGRFVTSPQCVLSVEHSVIQPLDSSATSMKAGVNSGDACRAKRLELDYHRDLHVANPKIPLISSPLATYISLLLCPLPHFFYPWLPFHLGPSLFFPLHSGRSELSDEECYLSILGHSLNDCWCSSHFAFEEMACMTATRTISLGIVSPSSVLCNPGFLLLSCHTFWRSITIYVWFGLG